MCRTLEQALDALDQDRGFLTEPEVFTDDLIDARIALKRAEIGRSDASPIRSNISSTILCRVFTRENRRIREIIPRHVTIVLQAAASLALRLRVPYAGPSGLERCQDLAQVRVAVENSECRSNVIQAASQECISETVSGFPRPAPCWFPCPALRQYLNEFIERKKRLGTVDPSPHGLAPPFRVLALHHFDLGLPLMGSPDQRQLARGELLLIVLLQKQVAVHVKGDRDRRVAHQNLHPLWAEA